MKYTDYFAFLVDEIHSVIAATVDENGLPVTCAIDIMDWDENGLYFLTAKGKNFYHRLKRQKYIALTGVKGEDTMSSTALSIGGKVTEVGAERLLQLFRKNPYMHEIYPTAESAAALTVFQMLEKGNGLICQKSRSSVTALPLEKRKQYKTAILSAQNAVDAECV